jgi:hypothetical protein
VSRLTVAAGFLTRHFWALPAPLFAAFGYRTGTRIIRSPTRRRTYRRGLPFIPCVPVRTRITDLGEREYELTLANVLE